jgi:hypothetical protein
MKKGGGVKLTPQVPTPLDKAEIGNSKCESPHHPILLFSSFSILNTILLPTYRLTINPAATMKREDIVYFGAGPAALPTDVLATAAEALQNYDNTGL